jgi:hypothetical protein
VCLEFFFSIHPPAFPLKIGIGHSNFPLGWWHDKRGLWVAILCHLDDSYPREEWSGGKMVPLPFLTIG